MANKKKAATRVAAKKKPREPTHDEQAEIEMHEDGGKRAAEEDGDTDFATPAPNPQLRALEKLAESTKHWRPAREVLTKVRAVPTIFVQYDRATRVHGHPIERFAVVHGPSGHGKTTFTHGLGLSFLMRDHVYGNIDAEYTTPELWLQELMAGYAVHPGFLALRPETYEQTVDAVRELVRNLAKAVTAGGLKKDTSALVVVDSISKLVPEDMWEQITKKGAEGKEGSVDGKRGRGAMIKAAMNAVWMDELTPLLAHTGTALLAIARESVDVDADANARKYGTNYHVKGGTAVEYDASLAIRITRASWVKDGAGDDARVVGERHRVTIRKTKVSGKDDKNIVCYFHTSNGVLIPPGFDRARDVLELAVGYGIVETGSGGWHKWGSSKWQGASAAVRKLTEKPEALAKMEEQVRARFAPDDVLEVADEDPLEE